jgi:hypothetical protein
MNSLSIRCPSLRILLPSFPEIGIEESEGYSEAFNLQPDLTVIDHNIDLDALVRFIMENPSALIHCSAWGMKPAFYNDSRSYLRSIINRTANQSFESKSEMLRFHIRGGDVWQTPSYKRSRNIHPDYMGIPVSFYKSILERANIPVEFVIEKTAPSWYLRMLQNAVGIKLNRSKSTPAHDFLKLASSTQVGLGISTFSWMSAFIGEPHKVHLPVLGIFDTDRRPDLDFYNPTWNIQKYKFEKHSWTGTRSDKDWLRFSKCELVD